MKKIYIFVALLLLIGCGGDSKKVNSSDELEESTVESDLSTATGGDVSTTTDDGIKKIGKAQLGVMANGTVKLYEMDGDTRKLIATEITSKGETIASIGNFDLHTELLADNKLYLYEVSGGEDWDVDDNGDIDDAPTQNRGSFQLLAKGDSIKKSPKVGVTLVSSIFYSLMLPYLDSSKREDKLNSFSQEIIAKDIDGDGKIGVGDILGYDPILDSSSLAKSYRAKISEMLSNILNGRAFDFEQVVSAVYFVNSGISYPRTEAGVQNALDHGYYSYVIGQLKNNRDAYGDMDDDEVNMNIAGAYVGISGYTVFDITGAIATGNDNNNSLNGFVHDITEDNNPLYTLEGLAEADQYYSEVVDGLNCSDTSTLSDDQKASCFNLGLVRLTSLSNSVKLLFGGDEELVRDWADGVDVNSSDDLNGNHVVDGSDASACAIVYANDPNDNCRDGSMFTYRGRVSFNRAGVEYNTTLLEIDVGSATLGFRSFFKLTTNKDSNNSVVLTSGICDKNFNMTTNAIDGTNYFPCPTVDSNQKLMTIADSLATSSHIQGLFPTGSDTRDTVNGYIQNLTGSADGIIDQNNLSNYLQRH